MSTQEIEQRLLAHLRGSLADPEDVDGATDLLALGVLDSLMVADLFVFIETKLDVVLSATDITPHNFRSVQRLAELVAAKRRKPSQAA
jgi:acyl carrier protein